MFDKQAEDDLAETMFVVRLKLKESDAHRFRPHGTDHGRLDLDGIFVRSRLDDEFEKGALWQRRCRLKRTAAHGNIRDAIIGPHSVMREKIDVK